MITLSALLLPLAEEAWFSSETTTYMGAYGGAILGSLGGMLGAGAGLLVPRGRGKLFVLPAMAVFAGIGMLCLIMALAAVVVNQPSHVVFPFILLGFVLCSVMIPLFFVTRKLYAQAEQRKLEADSLRHS